MSRVERVEHLLQSIEYETRTAFDEHTTLLNENRRLAVENAKLQEYAARAWGLFLEHGAVHACDLHEVDAVRDGLAALGVEVD